MKIVLAPDSFKGSLTALQVTDILAAAARHVFGEAVELVRAPIADGGEGTLEAILSARPGEKRTALVTGPMGEPVRAAYAFLSVQTALIEMAQTAGLALMGEKRDPMKTTTRGVGELMRRALDEGARRILIGLGGSATNDGGMGMLRALGVRFEDRQGREVPEGAQGLLALEKMDLSGLDARLKDTELIALTDVTNPLLGENGAAMVYGPQKGADACMLQLMEQGMTRYAQVAGSALNRDIASFPGAGAAGGLGAAVCGVLGGRMTQGIDAMLSVVGFEQLLAGADLCVTGEGRIDEQSVHFGKAISGIARRCVKAGVPLAVLAGSMSLAAQELFDMLPSSIMVTVNAPMRLEEAMAHAPSLLLSAAERMFRLIDIGRQMTSA